MINTIAIKKTKYLCRTSRRDMDANTLLAESVIAENSPALMKQKVLNQCGSYIGLKNTHLCSRRVNLFSIPC